MKKILICLLVAIVLTNCEIRVKEVSAQIKGYHTERQLHIMEYINSSTVCIDRISIDSMDYALVWAYQGGLQMVNLTKDKLEVELLRKQLNK